MNPLAFRRVLRTHQEGEHVSTGGAGPKTAPGLPVGENEERRRFLRMKGAKATVAGSRALKGHVLSNQVQNLEPSLDIVDNGHEAMVIVLG